MSQSAAVDLASRFESGEKITPETIAGLSEEAATRLQGFAAETPLLRSDCLSGHAAEVWIKDETGHPGGSFKDRGGGNSVLYHAEQGEGLVVTSSAGNHALGVGRAAVSRGMTAVTVVPESASEAKKEALKHVGVTLVEHGDNFDDALVYGLGLAEELGGRFVHPFADPRVIAGQGTIGLELLKQSPDMTHVVLPVGGGGMLAGVAAVIKQHRQDVKIVAAQVAGNTAYVDSLETGKPLQDQPVNTRFEGIAVGNVHPLTFDIARPLVDRTVIVEPEELDRAMYDHMREHKVVLERAGAVSPAATKKLSREDIIDEQAVVVAIASGSNAAPHLSRWLLARGRRLGWNQAA